MLRISLGKIMRSRKVLLGTHIEVVVIDGIQHSVYPFDGGNLDRTWRQSFVI